jgi:hypothetical protein
MPYTGPNDSNLPSYVKKREEAIRKKWVAMFNKVYEQSGESKALIIANTWLKKQVQSKSFVKRSALSFDIDESQGFIKRSDNGDDYITFVLNTTTPHKDGVVFSEEMLRKWADYINANPIVGDIDHKLYDEVLHSGMSDDMVQSVLKSKKGIAKTLRAVYENGKLWVKAIIDKRYRKVIEKSNGVSAEAFCTWNGKKAIDGDLLGFTFNVRTTPADSFAGVRA